MKNVILMLLVFTFTMVNGCKEKEQSGYNCNNGNCTAVFENPQYLTLSDCQSACGSSGAGYNCVSGNCVSVSSNAQYSTLSACQSACANNRPGGVAITASWTTSYVNCNPAYTVVIGLGYSSTDVANETYFAQSGNILYSPANYTNSNLAPGTYYYKAKKTYRASFCAPGNGTPPAVTKSGAFTITSYQLTNVNVGSLN